LIDSSDPEFEVQNLGVQEHKKMNKVMVIISRKLRNYLINTMEGAGVPATSFEDIGKSRFM